ncbi:hypothetical protein P8935_21545 [Telmatobacter sp. DSM 110680]|uniref:DUF3592 domain-containing protein n=1 Tax=Telmatobacter sp. DSM 110680 TaxID=3036704 RepID=A0AAU7DHD2_9BACT
MAFFNDLDFLAGSAVFVAIVASCFVTIANLQDWRNDLKIEVDGRATLITFFGIAFLVGAISSYSPNANAPRRTVEGIARFVAESHGRHQFDEYICASSCQLTGGYALDLRDRASNYVRIGSRYVFTYLEKPVGGAFSGISLRVIAISEPDSGRVLYALDLTNHPYRIAAYLLDFTLVVSAGLLGGFLNRTRRLHATTSNEEPDESEVSTQGDGPISLGLESKDAS